MFMWNATNVLVRDTMKTLEIKFKDKNISDVLEMTVNEAEEFLKQYLR